MYFLSISVYEVISLHCLILTEPYIYIIHILCPHFSPGLDDDEDGGPHVDFQIPDIPDLGPMDPDYRPLALPDPDEHDLEKGEC